MDSNFFTTHKTYEKEEVAKAWAHVGRFMWGFAQVENGIDVLIGKYFGLNKITWTLIISTLDFRKKLQFLELGCKFQKIDPPVVFSAINELHDIRNMIAHCRFVPDYGNNDDKAGEGIEFDYFKPGAKSRNPKFASEGLFWSALLTYAEFESYDKKMSVLCSKLHDLSASLKPITELNADMMRDIEMIIERSNNVLRFPAQT